MLISHFQKNVTSLHFLILISLILTFNITFGIINHRQRRFVVQPKGGKVQLIIGYGVPVDLQRETVIFGISFKGSWQLPTNATQLFDKMPIINDNERRKLMSRWDIYKIIVNAFNNYGLNGKICLLQLICNIAYTHPLWKLNGFIGKVLHLILTPTSTKENLNHHSDNEYYAAEKLGKVSKGQCRTLFGECKLDLLNLFTKPY